MNRASAGQSSDGDTLLDIVRRRAAIDSGGIAYTFLADGAADASTMTWSELERRSAALGSVLVQAGAAGEAVLLALPSGLAFIEALFACWYAGAIAVPISLPRQQRHRLQSIMTDSQARFAIGSDEMRQRLQGDRGALDAAPVTWIEATAEPTSPSPSAPYEASKPHVALLQYTSGSTGIPRGVVVTHANLMRNSALIAEACGHGPGDTIAGWLPLFHDMGLIGLVMQGAFSGAHCVFMPPERFLMRPWLWLQMLSDYRACSSPAPNFAYDLGAEKTAAQVKAKLDLSSWRNALNGSESVQAATLQRFAQAFSACGFKPEAFLPCYGLAEATLLVTAPVSRRALCRRRADGTLLADSQAGGHVGCGRSFGDTQVAIVDPATALRVAAGAIGEIWVSGSTIAAGYWNNPDATAATFQARLNEPAGADDRDVDWLRTGDLGFMAEGDLFITGRLREMIIIFGRNHFPVDIERTAESADPAIGAFGAVAFSLTLEGAERLIVVAEVRRDYGRAGNIDPEAVRRSIRAAVVAENEVAPHDVVLLRRGTIPRTSSGKVSRSATRNAYLSHTLRRFEETFNAR